MVSRSTLHLTCRAQALNMQVHLWKISTRQKMLNKNMSPATRKVASSRPSQAWGEARSALSNTAMLI